jgi:hypothetical protein
MNSLHEFIELWLSRIPNNLEIRPLKQKTYQPAKTLFSRNPREIETYIKNNNDCHSFFGVLGREGQKGEKENVRQVHCLWVDIDFKDLPDGQIEADGILATFDLPPTFVIHSGGGYHAYWFLNEPVKDFEKAERILRGLAIRLKADLKAAERARILRVPFTQNWKYSPPRPVAVQSYEPENTYDFEQFFEWELKESNLHGQHDEPEWFKEGRRDNDLYYTGCRLIDGGATPGHVKEVLTRLVSSWDERDPKWVATKVKAALKTITKERAGVEQRIKSCVESLTGRISIAAMSSWLNLQGEKKYHAENIIHQLAREGRIVWIGDAHGVFRPVDANPHIMDLEAPLEDTVPVELPFKLHTIVCLYSKNVIIVAGEKDSGKTAFAINTAFLNRDILPVTYFNSEMGREELLYRLKNWPRDHYPITEWKKIRWIERAHRFEDLIDANGLNIIDFLEVGAEAFTVSEDIRRCFDKLEKGLLLIVMQKRSYKEHAVGGEATLEKARLAINLEHRDGRKNVCKITVAKNWTGVIHAPRGCEAEYKIFNGAEMQLTDEWHRPESQTKTTKPRGF